MLVPEDYRPADPSWVTELIRRNPLAILVTGAGHSYPMATHVPTILNAPGDDADPGGLTDASILGHMNKLNPHWESIQAGGPALLIFHGPHGYVSPAVYQISPAAPTWNFTSVHVRGTLSVVPGGDATLAVIKQTVLTLEATHGSGWDMTGSLGYFDKLLPGVGAFRLAVHEVDSMFKLSQEQAAEVRDRTATAFEAGRLASHGQLAELMRRSG